MIAQIKGKLSSVGTSSALIEVGDIGYEVMLAGYCINRLTSFVGKEIMLCTMEYYEGTPGRGNLIPRLVGFLNSEERVFFQKFTSVKGIGIKKGLKALSMPIETIAGAIENGDEKLLTTLPSVGKRMAQQIIAELKGKLEKFAGAGVTASGEKRSFNDFQIEALEILVAWGEKRNEAQELIVKACENHPDIKTAEQLVPFVYRIKQGYEV